MLLTVRFFQNFSKVLSRMAKINFPTTSKTTRTAQKPFPLDSSCLQESFFNAPDLYPSGQVAGETDKMMTEILKTSSSSCWSVESYDSAPGILENVPTCRKGSGTFSEIGSKNK